ncbi:hypothetical protein A7L39_18120 [Acinetobacter baumannii]|nr:hypothetical protein A7L39_18120 [Acinetobacter baumannii]
MLIFFDQPHSYRKVLDSFAQIDITGPGSAIGRASAPGTGGPGFDPGPRHTKVVKNGSGIAPLLTLKQI